MLDPIVVSPQAQWMAFSAAMGLGVGYIIGWLKGLCEAERNYEEKAAKESNQ